MPAEDSVDSEGRSEAAILDAVAERLARSAQAALAASHELMAHYADTGERPTQRAVDTLIEHAAEALGALSDTLADAAQGLRMPAPDTTTVRSAESDGFPVRSRRRSECPR